MAKASSINLKVANPHQIYHNIDERPSYVIGAKDDGRDGVEYSKNTNEAIALRDRLVRIAQNNYNKHKAPKAPKFKAKSYLWSAVVNVKNEHTISELKVLTKAIKKKFGFNCYQIANHRDEGHINERGEKIINYHAHLEFVTLDLKTGKNLQRTLNRAKLRELQDLVAETLKMERGVDRRQSKVKRIEPRAYGALAELQKRIDSDSDKSRELEAKIKELQIKYAKERERMIAENKALKEQNEALKYTQADYQELKRQYEASLIALENERKAREKAEKERDDERKLRESAERERDELKAQLAKQSPQIAQGGENQTQSAAADKENKGEKTTQTPQGVEGLTAFEGGFYTPTAKFYDIKSAENKASELQKQGFKVAIFSYNDKFGIMCAIKSLYESFKTKFKANYPIDIKREFEPKEQESQRAKEPESQKAQEQIKKNDVFEKYMAEVEAEQQRMWQETREQAEREYQRARELESQRAKEPESQKAQEITHEPQKEKSNSYGMSR